MTGKLYAHKVAPSEIKSMLFKEIKYWHKWNLAIDEGYEKAMKDAKGKK